MALGAVQEGGQNAGAHRLGRLVGRDPGVAPADPGEESSQPRGTLGDVPGVGFEVEPLVEDQPKRVCLERRLRDTRRRGPESLTALASRTYHDQLGVLYAEGEAGLGAPSRYGRVGRSQLGLQPSD